MNANKHKHSIISKAQELGFFYCGFSKAGFLEEEAPKLENWLKNNTSDNFPSECGPIGSTLWDHHCLPHLCITLVQY